MRLGRPGFSPFFFSLWVYSSASFDLFRTLHSSCRSCGCSEKPQRPRPCPLIGQNADSSRKLLYKWDGETRSLRVQAIPVLNSDLTTNTHILKLIEDSTTRDETDWLSDGVRGVLINQSGTWAAVVGAKDIIVVRLPNRYTGSAGGGEVETIYCRAKIVGAHYNANDVLEVKWHPLSPDCIVVLTADSELRFYHILAEGGPKIPEPEFSLRCGRNTHSVSHSLYMVPEDESSEAALSFDFGPRAGWDWFSIFVLREGGEVVSFCPVVPAYSIVPIEVLDVLETSTENLSGATRLQQSWLEKLRLSSALRRVPISKGAFFIESAPDGFTPQIQVYSKPDTDMGGQQISILESVPALMLIADGTEDGSVRVCSSMNLSHPSWITFPGECSERDGDELQIFVLECLRLNSSVASTPQKSAVITILPDPQLPGRFFVYDACGAYQVDLVYLEKLRRSCETGSQLPQFRSSQRKLVEVQPVDGTAVFVSIEDLFILAGPQTGYYWVGITSDDRVSVNQLLHPRITAADNDGLIEPKSIVAVTSTRSDKYFSETIRDILDAYPIPPVVLNMRNLKSPTEIPSEMLKKGTGQLSMYRAVMRAHENARGAIDRQCNLLKKIEAEQLDTLKTLESRFIKLHTRNESARKECASRAKSAEHILHLARTIVSRLDKHIDIQSDSERDYHSELQSMKKTARKLEHSTGVDDNKLKKMGDIREHVIYGSQASNILGEEDQYKLHKALADFQTRVERLVQEVTDQARFRNFVVQFGVGS